jgi:hypothetical protein
MPAFVFESSPKKLTAQRAVNFREGCPGIPELAQLVKPSRFTRTSFDHNHQEDYENDEKNQLEHVGRRH